MTGSDDPPQVRAEDADVAAVHRWHAAQLPLPEQEPEVRQFRGGASIQTILLRYPDRELVLRRPPAGARVAAAHDVRREHRVQAALAPVYRDVPQLVALCEDDAVLGSDCYVLERVPGQVLRGRLPDGLELSCAQAFDLGLRAVDSLLELQQVDVAAVGLADLGRGPGYVGRQVAGWADDDLRRPKRQPTDLPGRPTRAQVVAHDAARTRLPVDDWLFSVVFGLFRLAAIAQQISYRYVHGQRTPASTHGLFVAHLETRCRAVAGLA